MGDRCLQDRSVNLSVLTHRYIFSHLFNPTASSSANKNGVYINSTNNGFKITVPADTQQRTIKIYVGGWNSGGTLTASLSDGSTSNYVSAMSTAATGQYNRTFTLVYKAGSASQTLNIEWKMTTGSGNVTLYTAALSTPGST